MNKQDLGVYLLIWLMINALAWLLDIEGELSIKSKIIVPVIVTAFIALLRIAIFLMIGE